MKEDLFAASLNTFHHWTRRLPEEKRYEWARRLALWSRGLVPQKWRAVAKNLSVINEWSGRNVDVKEVFENFALTLCDFLFPSNVKVEVEGREKAETARSAKRGVIILTSHIGNWELGGKILAGWDWPVTAVYQPYQSSALQNFIQKRRAPGLKFLAVGEGAAKGMARVLKQQEAVALLGDRPFGEEGLPVTLFGKKARLPKGPFVLACRHGVPVIPGFVIRERAGFYRGIVEEPLWPQGRSTRAVQNLMQQAVQVLQVYISRYAEQWYCFESVWPEN